MTTQAPEIVLTDAPVTRPKAPQPCPVCRAGVDRRVKSAGFGEPHDVCGKCGYEWPLEASRG